MKLHTDNLTEQDLRDALIATGLRARGVYFDSNRGMTTRRSRSRHHSITFYLVADPGHGRRWANSGNGGAGPRKAATWHEWGALLGELFHRDPDAIANEYNGARDFESKAVRPWMKPEPDEARTLDEWRTMFAPVSVS